MNFTVKKSLCCHSTKQLISSGSRHVVMVAALKIFQNLLRQVAVVFAASYHGLTKASCCGNSRPGHWDIYVSRPAHSASLSPWEILVHHGIAGWNTTSLSLIKNGFVILNTRIDRSSCQTGDHMVCQCLSLYILFLSSSLGTAYHISQSYR